MSSVPSLNNTHHHWWEHFKLLKQTKQLPQAILLIGPQHIQLNDFAKNLAAATLCDHPGEPCNICQSCKLINEATHPDLFFLEPEKKFHPIKIDQVRALQDIVFISPQVSQRRVIVINPAEDMNLAAANALLKLLEEPPDCVLFVLIVEQLGTLIPTIISRCQLWHCSNPENLENEYIELGKKYDQESFRGQLFQELPRITDSLLQLIDKQLSIIELAKQWKNYELKELIWLLYLIQSQVIYYHFFAPQTKNSWTTSLLMLSEKLPPFLLFKQMDKFHEVQRKLNQQVSMNPQLLLENLLLGYLS